MKMMMISSADTDSSFSHQLVMAVGDSWCNMVVVVVGDSLWIATGAIVA